MTGRLIAVAGVIGLAALGGGLGGCQQGKMKEDVARLQSENEALKSDRQALANRVALLEQQQVTPPNPRPDLRPTGNPSRPMPETRVEVAGDKLFASGSTTIMAAGKSELDKVANRIKREFPNSLVRVEGYTDTDPPNKIKHLYPTNEALSLARAQEVEKYLASRGVPSGQIEAVGMGAASPKPTKAASRRVEIVIIGS